MKAGEAIIDILKRKDVAIVFGYPANHLLKWRPGLAFDRSSVNRSASVC